MPGAKVKKLASDRVRERIRTVLMVRCDLCPNEIKDTGITPTEFAHECRSKGWLVDYKDRLLCPECAKLPNNER